MKSGNLNFLEPSGPLQACNGIALPFTFTISTTFPIQPSFNVKQPEKLLNSLLNKP